MSKLKVYWAASLHSELKRARNTELAKEITSLLGENTEILLPQRHGIWEQMVKEELAKTITMTRDAAVQNVKQRCFDNDMQDLHDCDVCILYCPVIPSEGAIFEFAWCLARGKYCFIYCPDDIIYDDLNLMITKSAPRASTLQQLRQLMEAI